MNLFVTDIDSDYQSLIDNKDFTAVNFPIEKAVKIYGSSYDKLKGKDKLKLEIEDIIGFKDDPQLARASRSCPFKNKPLFFAVVLF